MSAIFSRVFRHSGVVPSTGITRILGILCQSSSLSSAIALKPAVIHSEEKQIPPNLGFCSSKSATVSISKTFRIVIMDKKWDQDNEKKDIPDQRKREGEKVIYDELSPPSKKRVMESEQFSNNFSGDSNIIEDINNSANSIDLAFEVTAKDCEKACSVSNERRAPLNSRSDSVESIAGSFKSNENLSSCEVSLALNETECESLESSLVCFGNSLDDLSTSALDLESNKDESEAGYSAAKITEARTVKKKKKRKRKMSKSDQESGDNKHMPNIRPNFFVGVQVSNSEIHKNIIEVQEALLSFEPALSRALVDVATSHITLLIAHLEDEEALSLACSALDDYSKEFEKDLKALKLTFSGIDNFSNNVLYARVVEDEHHQRLLDIADSLRLVFAEKGVCLPNMKPLNPHLTIAKMSKAPRGKGKAGPRKIEPQSYAAYRELHFGSQHVSSLQLLAMNLPKDDKRYYFCCKEVDFGEKLLQKSDHSHCCFPRRPFISTVQHRSFSTKTPGNQFSYLGSAVGCVTALAASLMIVYVVGKVSGRL